MSIPPSDAVRAPLSSEQGAFAAALLDPEADCPPGLRAWNGSDPARRFAVYRNNVVSALIGALADTFPVVQQSVGEAFFRAMAAVFVRQQPPRSPVLARHGEAFAGFVADFPPAASLPWLADLARLEYARLAAQHAADRDPIGRDAFAAALADPDALAGARIDWHPSLRTLASPWAVVSWWAAHQQDEDVPSLDIDHPEAAVVLRDGLQPLVLPVPAAALAFIDRTAAGAPLAEAAADALAADPSFDPGSTLARLIAHGAVVALHGPSTSSPRS